MSDKPYSRGGLIGGGGSAEVRLSPVSDPSDPLSMSWDEGIYCPKCKSIVPALVWATGGHRGCAEASGTGLLHAQILDMPDEMLQAWAAVEKEPGWCPTCRNGVSLGDVQYRCTACGVDRR